MKNQWKIWLNSQRPRIKSLKEYSIHQLPSHFIKASYKLSDRIPPNFLAQVNYKTISNCQVTCAYTNENTPEMYGKKEIAASREISQFATSSI